MGPLSGKRTATVTARGLTLGEGLRRAAGGALDRVCWRFDGCVIHSNLLYVVGIELHVNGLTGGEFRPRGVRDGLLGVGAERRAALGKHFDRELQHGRVVSNADAGIGRAEDFGGRFFARHADLVVCLLLGVQFVLQLRVVEIN